MRDRLEDEDEFLRQVQRHHQPLAGRNLGAVDDDRLHDLFEILRQVDARPPVELTEIFADRQRFGRVGGDAPYPRADGEGHLDQFVERRLVARRAERADVFVLDDGLQRRVRLQHPAAAGAQHVPRYVEQTERRGMEETGDGRLLVEAIGFCEGERIDAAKAPIGAEFDGPLDGRGDGRNDRLTQDRDGCMRFAHDPVSDAGMDSKSACRRWPRPAIRFLQFHA